MGTYNLDKKEIADIFESLEFESHCEGDFTEKQFIEGAKLYIKDLRKQGAFIPKDSEPYKKPEIADTTCYYKT